jgi:hypothetical protein
MAAFEKIINVQHAWPGSSRANLPPNMRHTHPSHQNRFHRIDALHEESASCCETP